MILQKLKSKLSEDAHFNEMIKGSIVTFFIKLLGMATGYLLIYFVSRKFGANGVGYYTILNQLLLVVGMIAGWGTPTLVLRYMGEHNVQSLTRTLITILGKLTSILLPFSIILGLLLYFYSEVISERVFSSMSFSKGIQIIAIIIPLFTLNNLLVEGLRGMKKLQYSEFLRSLFRPLFVSSFLLVAWDQIVQPIDLIYILSLAIILSLIMAFVFILFSKRLSESLEKQFVYSLPAVFNTSTPIMFSSFFGLLISSMDLFFVQYYLDDAATGVYSVAVRLSAIISISLIVVNTISAPNFSRLFFQKDMVALQKIVHQSTKLIFILSGITTVVLVSTSPFLLGIFGDEFTKGLLPMLILILGQLINSATGSVGLLLNMSGHQNFLRNSAFVTLLVQTLLFLILVPNLGLLGAATGSTIASFIWNASCVIYVKRKLGIRTYYIPFN